MVRSGDATFSPGGWGSYTSGHWRPRYGGGNLSPSITGPSNCTNTDDIVDCIPHLIATHHQCINIQPRPYWDCTMEDIPVAHRPHPCSRYLAKEYPSNDLGDGPPKKSNGKPAPVKGRASIASFFSSCPSKNTAPAPQQDALPLQGAITNGAREIVPRLPTHDIIASADLALAIPRVHATILRSRLRAITNFKPPSMEETLHAIADLDIQLAMRRDMSHFTATPMNGFCTVCVLDAVSRKTHPVPFNTPGLTRHIITTLSDIQARAHYKGHLEIVTSMQRYLDALNSSPTPTSLPSSEWMDESLTMATGRLTNDSLFQTWTEHTQGVFPKGWMQLNAAVPNSIYQQPASGAADTFPNLFQMHIQHCGFATSHHFLIQYDNTDLLRQLQWLTLNLASSNLRSSAHSTALPSCPPPDAPVLTDPPGERVTPRECVETSLPTLENQTTEAPTSPAHHIEQHHCSTMALNSQPDSSLIALPSSSDACMLLHGNLLLRISARQFSRLYSQVSLTAPTLMHSHVRALLISENIGRYISCAVHPELMASDRIPSDGFCAYHSLWALAYSDQATTKFKDRRHLRTVMSPLCLDISTQGDRVANALARLTRRANLPRSLWPPFPQVANWANQSQPTFMWSTSATLPMPWLDLSGIPNTEECCTLASTWTLQDLLLIKENSRHLALDSNHYFPIVIDPGNWETAAEAFCLTLTEKVLEHRKTRQGPPPEALLLSLTTKSSSSHCPPGPTERPPDPHPPTAPLVSASPPGPLDVSPPNVENTLNPVAPTRIKRVHFSETIDDSTTARIPVPIVHPAMSRYLPPKATQHAPTASSRFLPRKASGQTTRPDHGGFPLDAELYILTSQADVKDDRIVIGPSPFPGSAWAAFARSPSQYGDTIGRYSHHRNGREPCTHPSDPTASTGEYAMERSYKGNIIRQDPWMVDTCHARFVEEAPTFEQVNVDWITRNGNIYLINVSIAADISIGDLYLTNYGEEYWHNTHTPLPLLRLMYTKYAPVMSNQRKQAWQQLLHQVTRAKIEARTNRLPPSLRRDLPAALVIAPLPGSIAVPHARHAPKSASVRADRPSVIIAPPSVLTERMRQQRRRCKKRAHKQAVLLNDELPTRVTPPCRLTNPILSPPHSGSFNSITWAPPLTCANTINNIVAGLISSHSPDVLWLLLQSQPDSSMQNPCSDMYVTLPCAVPVITPTAARLWPMAIIRRKWINQCQLATSKHTTVCLNFSALGSAYESLPLPATHHLSLQSYPLPDAVPQPAPLDTGPDLWSPDWTYSIHPTSAQDTPLTSLAIMHWPCRGALYCPGQYISNEVRHTIHFITRIMQERHIDIMWISDAHILVGMLDPYLPDIYRALPDCRVLQFPTTRISTTSYNKSNECMGGAMAIVTAAWKGFITASQTDSMGLGILNNIDFHIQGFKFSSACYYFPPYTPGTGAATIHSRVTRFQQSAKAPVWSRRMTSHEFIRALAQKQQEKAMTLGQVRLVCGDFNANTTGVTAATTALRNWCNTCSLHDPARTTKHLMPGHLTRQANSDKQVDTTLDHHFHSQLDSNSISLSQLGTMNHPDTWRRSDHLPTWMTLALSRFVPTVPTRRSTPTAIRCDIDLQNKKELTRYQELLTQAMETLPKQLLIHLPDGITRTTPRRSGRLVAALLRLSVQVVENKDGLGKANKRGLSETAQKTRSAIKDGYSPTQQLLHSYAVFYRCIIRKVFSTTRNAHTRFIWNSTSAYSLLTTWRRHWQDKYYDVLSTTTLPPQARDLPHPRTLCLLPVSRITLAYLRQLIQQVNRHLHGADRLRMRILCNAAIRKREELRLKGHHAKLIELLTHGGARADLDLSTIPCPTTGQIVAPEAVHQHVLSHFADWYAIPATLDPAGTLLATNMEWTRSLLHYLDTGHPQHLHPQSKIPLNLQDGIRRACAIKVSAHVQQQLLTATTAPLTFTEFDQALNEIRAGSAPGPSEATANMIKGWPPPVRRLAYAHMNNMWLSKFTPLWMKDKVVKLAPKIPGSSDLANMRPISLYEVIRKVWTTTIAKRIHLVWHTHGVLNTAQYGYRLDQGTHMALINVLNTIESAHHDRIPTAITFWDVRRAFDSIPRTLQQLAWERLGVPHEIAHWFVQMDDGGLSFLATPLYADLKSLKGHSELLRADGHMSRNPHLAIVPQRGVGQGESASSLLWTAVYDMLLDWIDPCNLSLHHFEKMHLQLPFTPQDAAQACATAYADDLATTSRGPKAMILQQTMSTWLSAFGAFSGLALHPQKIIPVTINSPQLHKVHCITVRDHQWTSTTVAVQHKLDTYKYLGIRLNLQGNYTPSLHLTLQETKARLQHLLVQPASPQAKMLYIRAKIVPIVLYTACCMDWPLAAYAKLDAAFIHAYRRILSLPERTPNAMFHLPPHLCGIGLPCLTDLAQVRKWHVLQRCAAIGGAPARSVDAIFARIPGGLTPFDDWTDAALAPEQAKWPNCPTYMARSLIEWLAHNHLCCARRSTRNTTQREGQLLSTLAKDLQLWYDEEYYMAEDYEHHPVIAVTTDGAYKVTADTHADVLVPYTNLQDRASGGGGIVLTVNPRSTTQPHYGIHIHMDVQERGMTAYTWELLTQLVALHLIKEYPRSLPLRSDCMSAIARTNHALASYNDTLSTTKAGLLPTCMHQFSNQVQPRSFTHIPAHPENNEKRQADPTDDDMAIFLADIVADGHNNIDRVTLGPRSLSFQPHTLTLRHIFHELIPAGTWHIRHLTHSRSPVLGDLMTYQHATRLHAYTTKRDEASAGTYWADTSYALAHALHPPVANTPWHLARRGVTIFDKTGHGANRAKVQSLTPTQALAAAECTHCGALDSQEHCMIECPHPAFVAIRKKARVEQDRAARDALCQHGKSSFLDQFTKAMQYYSWSSSSPYIRRLWIGTWSPQLYQALIAPLHMTSPCAMAERNTIISIAAALTAPLLNAHRQIVDHMTTSPSTVPMSTPPRRPLREPLPLLDHLPADNHRGGSSHHPMATAYHPLSPRPPGTTVSYDVFHHVQPITTTSALLPLTPDYSDPVDYDDPDNNDCDNSDVSIHMHNRLCPDDGRLYDDS